MSIEYFGTTSRSFDQHAIAEFLDKLAKSGWARIVRQSNSELGFVNASSDERTPESTTIRLGEDTIYIGFHAATRNERDLLLALVQRYLLELGVTCQLEEL